MGTEFLEDVGEQFKPDDLEQLEAYLNLLEETSNHISRLEAELKQYNDQKNLLSREQIPELLLSRGLSELKTADGKKVIVREKIACGVPKDPVRKRNVLKWVVEMGGESIIDKSVSIDEPEESVTNYLLENGIPFTRSVDIHWARFRSFVSELIGLKKGSIATIEPKDVPQEANLYIYKETEIK